LEINAAIDANPLLERAEDVEQELASFEQSIGNGNAESESAETPAHEGNGESDTAMDTTPEFDWDEGRTRNAGAVDYEDDGANNIPVPMDLHEHLQWQLRLSHLSAHDCLVGEA